MISALLGNLGGSVEVGSGDTGGGGSDGGGATFPPSPSGVNRVTEDGQLRVTENTNEQLITV